MKKLFLRITLYSICLYTLSFCTKSNNHLEDSDNPFLIPNQFVHTYMKDGYLWNTLIPSNIDPSKEENPNTLIEKLIYHNLDKWTYVSDNSESVMDDFNGISTTFGYSLSFRRFTNSNNVCAFVKYVCDDSPAQKAGIKRGDIILNYANTQLNVDNYLNLYYAASIDIVMGKIEISESSAIIKENGISHSLVAVKMYEDPINAYSIIENNGIKIGYLSYTQYVYNSHSKLNQIFAQFKAEGVQEMILDLRYNPGGDARSPAYLASFLAPVKNVANGDVFLKEQWNQGYMDYYTQKKIDLNSYFDKTCTNNLGLSRVFILTTGSTASASEATISGLLPYLDVVLVGEKTYGKYCGAALVKGDKFNSSIGNWLLSLVIYKFVNIDGFTDFVNGIDVNYAESDDIYYSYQFGDINDPITAKALSIINGQQIIKTNTIPRQLNTTILPDINKSRLYGNDILLD